MGGRGSDDDQGFADRSSDRSIHPEGGHSCCSSAKEQGGAGGAERSKDSVAGRDERTDDGIADAPYRTHGRVGDRDEGSNARFAERSGTSHESVANRQRQVGRPNPNSWDEAQSRLDGGTDRSSRCTPQSPQHAVAGPADRSAGANKGLAAGGQPATACALNRTCDARDGPAGRSD
jgi:hypothetical protein